MKKILTSMALISLGVAVIQAEELKFVTVLSQPISKTLFVNFCNTSVSTGKIDVQGMVKMNELRLTGSDARAGSATNKLNYQITEADGLEVGSGGSLLGGRLLANSANPQDITVAASTNINAGSTFIAADIPSMTIGGSTHIVYPAQSLVGSDVHWRGSTDDYRYNFKVDENKGVIKDGTTEFTSYPIRTDKRGGECRCGNSVSPFSSRHCTNEWNTQTCSSQESPSERRVGTIFWRFNYDTCKWYEADPKGYENTSNWEKWVKWTSIPSHHNCQCEGYSSGSYNDSTATTFDQQYGNPRFKSGAPRFKSGAINGNMVNEASASRTRLCQYDKVRGFGNKYDGNINESYDFNSCQWNLTSENCYCSTTSRGNYAPKVQYSGKSTTTRQCSDENSKWTGTITDTYNHDNCTWSYGDESVCAGQPSSLTKTESCPAGYTGSITYTYNTDLNVCAWEETSNTCTQNYCCLYELRNVYPDRVESGWRWDDIRNEDEALTSHESCSTFNNGSAFNCVDNAGSGSCYDGYDYDCCGYSEDCNCHNIYQDTMNVYFHYKECVRTDRKPCNEVPAAQASRWVSC